MRRQLATLASVALVAGSVATATSAGAWSGGSLSSLDRKFVASASAGALFEIKGGDGAMMKASDPDIKAYGAEMIAEHTTQFGELRTLGRSVGAQVAKAPEVPQQHITNLAAQLSGRAFDCAYVTSAYGGHVAEVNLFENAAAHARNTEVRAFAQKWLPVLKEHTKHAEELLLQTTSCTG